MPEALAPDYAIETLLGAGPSGTTYLARATDSGALLAVKIVTSREGLRDVPAVARGVGANLVGYRHPGIATTHAVDVDQDGNLRIVRDYIAGKPLAAWATRAGAPERRQLWERVDAALTAAHARGLAHGRLDPSNLIVGTGARPVIVDFGAHAALRLLQGREAGAAAMAEEDRAGFRAIRAVFDPT